MAEEILAQQIAKAIVEYKNAKDGISQCAATVAPGAAAPTLNHCAQTVASTLAPHATTPGFSQCAQTVAPTLRPPTLNHCAPTLSPPGFSQCAPYTGRTNFHVNNVRGLFKKVKKPGKKWERIATCLLSRNQCKVPSASMRMELARHGLSNKSVLFDSDGDSFHVQAVFYDAFPALTKCGGFSLLMQYGSDLLVIERPKQGYTVSYLKSVVSRGTLYVRPLQRDIDDNTLGALSVLDQSSQPSEVCLTCGNRMPLGDLDSHIVMCSMSVLKDDINDSISMTLCSTVEAQRTDATNAAQSRVLAVDVQRTDVMNAAQSRVSTAEARCTDATNAAQSRVLAVEVQHTDVMNAAQSRVSTVEARCTDAINVAQSRVLAAEFQPTDLNVAQSRVLAVEVRPTDAMNAAQSRVSTVEARRTNATNAAQTRFSSRNVRTGTECLNLNSAERRSRRNVCYVDLDEELSSDTEEDVTILHVTKKGKILDCDEIITVLKSRINMNEYMQLNVNRENVAADAFEAARKADFFLNHHLKVSFIGEEGIDIGGLKREFFRLFAIQSKDMFLVGKFFVNNMMALQRQDFLHWGQYVALSIAEGCCGLPYLSEAVYNYINSGQYIGQAANILQSELPHYLRSAVDKLKDCIDDPAIQDLLTHDEDIKSLLMESGFCTPPSSVAIDMKESIIELLLEYHCIIKCKAMQDQFILGLENLEVLSMVRENPAAMKKFFVSQVSTLCADSVLPLFKKCFETELMSEAEEKAAWFFLHFVEECGNGKVNCSLEELLIFFTAAVEVPPYASVEFVDGPFPFASTCDYCLRLPIGHNSYNSFKDAFILGIKCNSGFGIQ